MTTSRAIVCCIAAFCMAAGLAPAAWHGATPPSQVDASAKEPMRRVGVEVTATCEGKPLVGVGFVMRSAGSSAMAVTDAEGRARLEANVPATSRVVAVLPSSVPLAEPGEGFGARVLELNARLVLPHAFARWYRVGLEPGVEVYRLAIEVPRARRVTLSIKDTLGEPVVAHGLSRDVTLVAQLTSPDSAGVLVVEGLPRGRTSVIYLMTKGAWLRAEVPAGENDAVLEPITITATPDANCEIKITSKAVNEPHWRPDFPIHGVTLVSIDGRRFFSLRIGLDVPHAISSASSQELARVPAGTYYVVGGMFRATVVQAAVIERALAGEDLRALGVPTITAVPDKIAELEIDPWQVENLLLGEDNTDRPEYVPPSP